MVALSPSTDALDGEQLGGLVRWVPGSLSYRYIFRRKGGPGRSFGKRYLTPAR